MTILRYNDFLAYLLALVLVLGCWLLNVTLTRLLECVSEIDVVFLSTSINTLEHMEKLKDDALVGNSVRLVNEY